jgi:EAL domain-containing protein (putative c-di-GMP-specific phosphodiesterase class I)
MQAVAEGVETEVHHAALAKMSIWALQGYYIARPMDKDAFLTWLIEHYETT